MSAAHIAPGPAEHWWVFLQREHGYACVPAEILQVSSRGHMRVRTYLGRTASVPIDDYAEPLDDEARARYFPPRTQEGPL